jgi:hypothetical protein
VGGLCPGPAPYALVGVGGPAPYALRAWGDPQILKRRTGWIVLTLWAGVPQGRAKRDGGTSWGHLPAEGWGR